MGSMYVSLSQLIPSSASDGSIAVSDAESVECEAPTHDNMDLEDISSHPGIGADQVLEPVNEDKVIDQQRHGKMSQGADLDGINRETPENYGPGDILPLKAPKRGRKRPSQAPEFSPCELKKCARSGNWTPEETDILVRSKVQAAKTRLGRSSKSRNQAVWVEIAQTVPRRTGDQCRLLWDTLIKAYKKIKEHCHHHNVVLDQLDEEELRNMKLATCFKNPDWYKMIDENFPWTPMSGDQASSLDGASASTVAICDAEIQAADVDMLHPQGSGLGEQFEPQEAEDVMQYLNFDDVSFSNDREIIH